MKQCTDCGKLKDEKEFYVRKGYGLYSWCKNCHRLRVKKTDDPDKRRARVRAWLLNNEEEKEKRRIRNKEFKKKNRAKLREKQREYAEKNKGKIKESAKQRADRIAESTKKSREKYPEKFKARNKINHEIKMGRVERSICQVCGDPKAEAHHPDYSKPLEVEWLCRKHHAERHHLD